jgi:hypothetical protein
MEEINMLKKLFSLLLICLMVSACDLTAVNAEPIPVQKNTHDFNFIINQECELNDTAFNALDYALVNGLQTNSWYVSNVDPDSTIIPEGIIGTWYYFENGEDLLNISKYAHHINLYGHDLVEYTNKVNAVKVFNNTYTHDYVLPRPEDNSKFTHIIDTVNLNIHQ